MRWTPTKVPSRWPPASNLAIKAFEHTAAYDSMIANYFGSMVPAYHGESKEAAGRFPRTLNLNFIKKQDMRYGENSHQQAAFYIEENVKRPPWRPPLAAGQSALL